MPETADIFISYRRQCAEPNAQALDILLSDLKVPNRSNKLEVFIDKRALQPGGKWRDELKLHARSCKVLVLLVGEDWLQRFEQRGLQHIDDLDPETDDIDWVAAEMHYALSREQPASLLIVKAHQLVDLGGAASFFEHNIKVAAAFKRNLLEHAVFNTSSSRQDEQQLVAAVLRAYRAFDQNSSDVGGQTTTLIDRSKERAHWMKFMGREQQWQQLEKQMSVSPPGKPVVGGDVIDTWATCWDVECREDCPENLADAIGCHLATDGVLHWTAQDYSKAPSFSVRGQRDGVYLFNDIAAALGLGFEIAQGSSAVEAEQQIQLQFVPQLVNRDGATNRAGCCWCLVSTREQRELALQVCDIWNRLHWPPMRHKFLLVFFKFNQQSQASVIGRLAGLLRTAKRTDAETVAIGKLTRQCYQDWLDGFLQPSTSVDIRKRDPVWYEHLIPYQWPGDARYAKIESSLTTID